VVAGLTTFGLTLAGITNATDAFRAFAPGVTITVSAFAAGIVIVAGLLLGSASSLISLRRHLET
jgi:hypothetical protein